MGAHSEIATSNDLVYLEYNLLKERIVIIENIFSGKIKLQRQVLLKDAIKIRKRGLRALCFGI